MKAHFDTLNLNQLYRSCTIFFLEIIKILKSATTKFFPNELTNENIFQFIANEGISYKFL